MSVAMSVSQCPRTEEESQVFRFAYGAEDFRSPDTGSPADAVHLNWIAPSGWKMSEDLQALWRRILGPEGRVTYEHW